MCHGPHCACLGQGRRWSESPEPRALSGRPTLSPARRAHQPPPPPGPHKSITNGTHPSQAHHRGILSSQHPPPPMGNAVGARHQGTRPHRGWAQGRGQNGRTPQEEEAPPRPPLQTKATIVGKDDISHRENLVGPFLVRTFLGPNPPPPLPSDVLERPYTGGGGGGKPPPPRTPPLCGQQHN